MRKCVARRAVRTHTRERVHEDQDDLWRGQPVGRARGTGTGCPRDKSSWSVCTRSRDCVRIARRATHFRTIYPAFDCHSLPHRPVPHTQHAHWHRPGRAQTISTKSSQKPVEPGSFVRTATRTTRSRSSALRSPARKPRSDRRRRGSALAPDLDQIAPDQPRPRFSSCCSCGSHRACPPAGHCRDAGDEGHHHARLHRPGAAGASSIRTCQLPRAARLTL